MPEAEIEKLLWLESDQVRVPKISGQLSDDDGWEANCPVRQVQAKVLSEDISFFLHSVCFVDLLARQSGMRNGNTQI